jgi:hypothetical protein
MTTDEAITRLKGKAMFCKCEDCNAINTILAALAEKERDIATYKDICTESDKDRAKMREQIAAYAHREKMVIAAMQRGTELYEAAHHRAVSLPSYDKLACWLIEQISAREKYNKKLLGENLSYQNENAKQRKQIKELSDQKLNRHEEVLYWVDKSKGYEEQIAALRENKKHLRAVIEEQADWGKSREEYQQQIAALAIDRDTAMSMLEDAEGRVKRLTEAK